MGEPVVAVGVGIVGCGRCQAPSRCRGPRRNRRWEWCRCRRELGGQSVQILYAGAWVASHCSSIIRIQTISP